MTLKNQGVMVLTLDASDEEFYTFAKYPCFEWGPCSDYGHIKTFIYSKRYPLTCVSAFLITSRPTTKKITYRNPDGILMTVLLKIQQRRMAVVHLDNKGIKN